VDSMHSKTANKGGFAIVMVVALYLVLSIQVVLADDAPQDSAWTFSAAPYAWFVSLEGDVTVKGEKSHVDMNFSDIWDQMNIGAMIAFEASNGRWGLLSNVIYANLGQETSTNGIKIEPSIDLYLISLGGFYRFGTWALSNRPGQNGPSVSIDGTAGGRYTHINVDLDFKGIGTFSGNKDWIDPVVGMRTLFDFTERWSLTLDGSVGGFGVGSDFTWHAGGLVGYRFDLLGEKDAKLFGGYRALSWDYEEGRGRDKFEWNVVMHGPILGLGITF
jgi:hypothetical protein